MLNKIILFMICVMLNSASGFAGDLQVQTSSFLAQNSTASFDAESLRDGNYTTGWVTKGSGAGEWLKFDFPNEVIIDSLVIRNGLGNAADFQRTNRAKDIVLIYSDGAEQGFRLQDIESRQSPTVRKVPTTSLELSVRTVYSKAGDLNFGLGEIVVDYHSPSAEEYMDMAVSKAAGAAFKKIEAGSKKRKLTAEEKKKLYAKLVQLESKKYVLREMKEFFDKFYSMFVTINEEYPRMYSADNFLRESSMFESFRSMLETRGVLEKYQKAVVSTSGLRFSIRTLAPTEVELWVKGEYTVIYDMKTHQVAENALYHLVREYGEWKVKNKTEY